MECLACIGASFLLLMLMLGPAFLHPTTGVVFLRFSLLFYISVVLLEGLAAVFEQVGVTLSQLVWP